ncbi:hypothetical protein QJS04_geneDACA010486 [Acorus gramineus]|uniref:Uncharacterized protein n=1 Tax=Acorus gramineus TaxID=55184 RepID=A0AAV9AM08_ACOGR|nr:hypothetical protein QJS04_geneDACA010486 [Acorus gramineus]
MAQEQLPDNKDRTGHYILLRDAEDHRLGMFDKPLPCFGCGIGWFSFLLGFVCPFTWFYATILYFGNYYHKDPRERAGLAASAIAVISFSLTTVHGRLESKDFLQRLESHPNTFMVLSFICHLL